MYISSTNIVIDTLFLLAADHGQGLFAQRALARGAHVKPLFFPIMQLTGGRVEIANSTAPVIGLAGHLAITDEEIAQRGNQPLKVKRAGIAAPGVEWRQLSGSCAIVLIGAVRAWITFAALPR